MDCQLHYRSDSELECSATHREANCFHCIRTEEEGLWKEQKRNNTTKAKPTCSLLEKGRLHVWINSKKISPSSFAMYSTFTENMDDFME